MSHVSSGCFDSSLIHSLGVRILGYSDAGDLVPDGFVQADAPSIESLHPELFHGLPTAKRMQEYQVRGMLCLAYDLTIASV